MKWLGISFIAALMLLPLGAFPFSEAQTNPLTETGKDYFLTDNNDGSFTWQSHYDYLLENNAYVPYVVRDDPDIVQIDVSWGKLVFDKNACAVSIFDGDNIAINSDSYIVRTAEIGTDNWNDLAVNDSACNTVITENPNEVIVSLVRQNNEGIFEIEYVISGGQVKTTTKFTNQQYQNNKFAFTQTVNLDNIITLNGQDIDLSQMQGMTFDRDVLEQNRDLIFEAKELFFNAGLGFDQLWSISLYDGKVALDYGNQGENKIAIGETIELDPTYGYASATGHRVYTTSSTGNNCSTTANNKDNYHSIHMYPSTNNNNCAYPSFEWNTSSISTNAMITTMNVSLSASSTTNGKNIDIKKVTTQPSSASASQMLSDAQATGTEYVNNIGYSNSPNTLSSSAHTDWAGHKSWFAVAFSLDDQYNRGNIGSKVEIHYSTSGQTPNSPNPQLQVIYTIATVPNAITDLAATYNTPNIDLTWSLPSDGGSAITSFKVYRSTDGSNYSLYNTITSSTATSYQDTSPSSGNTNYYKVNAVNAVGEASDSNVASVFVGTPPDPPTSLTTAINNPNTSPFVISLSWTAPTNMGSGTLTGYEIIRDGSTVTTTSGSGTTYSDTVSSSGTYAYTIKTVTNHGTSTASNTSNISTPNPPDAITDLAATIISDTQIDLSWSAPSDGGSALTNYYIFRDSVNIQNQTTTTYQNTGLTGNTSYYYNVFAVNNAGTSLTSNTETKTTYTAVTGSIGTSYTKMGASLQIIPTANISAGTPTPTFSTIKVYDDGVLYKTVSWGNVYYHFPDGNQHTITLTATNSTHWNNPTISSGSITETSDYVPNWNSNNVAYNTTRTNNTLQLDVNRDITAGWDLSCEFQTTAQAMAKSSGLTAASTNVWAYQTQPLAMSDGEHVYITCKENSDIILSFTSYGPNLITGGISVLDDMMVDFLGAPAALIFIVLVAGLFGGRTAPTGILLVLALVGVLGFIGFMTIDELTWGIVMIAGTLGIFIGKRFL